MSTKVTLIYRDEPSLHIYHELLDDTIHIEIDRGGVLVDAEIMSWNEWVSLGLPNKAVHLQDGKQSK